MFEIYAFGYSRNSTTWKKVTGTWEIQNFIVLNFISFIEQRVSALLVSLLVGVSVLMSPLLRLVPMSVLFGVFLYMGISSVNGIQFFDRLRLFLMPVKHHPQVAYVRRVSVSLFNSWNIVLKYEEKNMGQTRFLFLILCYRFTPWRCISSQ